MKVIGPFKLVRAKLYLSVTLRYHSPAGFAHDLGQKWIPPNQPSGWFWRRRRSTRFRCMALWPSCAPSNGTSGRWRKDGNKGNCRLTNYNIKSRETWGLIKPINKTTYYGVLPGGIWPVPPSCRSLLRHQQLPCRSMDRPPDYIENKWLIEQNH